MLSLHLAGFLPVLIIVLISLAMAYMIVRDNATLATHKFVSIDGLRGFLAVMVFIHHSDYWFYYSHLKGWIPSGTLFYTNLGQNSICLFFMLSGFLFTYKLLEGRNTEIDWLKLYCSRFLRLTPLYICLIAAMIIIIALESHFVLHEDLTSLWRHISKWLFFTIQGHPNINGHQDTHLMTAGVIWTLPYEWFFYFSLPVIAVLVGTKSKANTGIWLILSCFSIYMFDMDTTLLYGFAGGGIAAVIAWIPKLRSFFQSKIGSWVVMAGLVVSYMYIDGSVPGMTYLRLLVLTICMAYIACGTSIFGLLSCRAARALSTISYGVYLLHGITLYFVMMHIIPTETRITLTEQQHWYIVFTCTPIVIALATLSWYLIEKPSINATGKLTKLIRRLHTSVNTAPANIKE